MRTVHEGQSLLSPRVLARLVARMPSAAVVGASALGEAWLRGRAVTEPEPSDWDEGGLPERLAWLRHLRAADAAAGRELVEQTRKEKAADRVGIRHI